MAKSEDPEFMDGFDDANYGFMAIDEDELNKILDKTAGTAPEEINDIKNKLDQIIELNSSCDGAAAVKDQYDELMKAKMEEIESLVFPLLINLKKNETKDYLHWPGSQRKAQCDLQVEKILRVTRS
jgi:hypothetical protein|tara:strand:- start:272 stop:649 length:378 start_codon:yes stop_codon:yes gene_type:complete